MSIWAGFVYQYLRMKSFDDLVIFSLHFFPLVAGYGVYDLQELSK